MKSFVVLIYLAFSIFVHAEEIKLPVYTQNQKIADGMLGVLASNKLARHLEGFNFSYTLEAITYDGEGRATFGPLFYTISFAKLGDSGQWSACKVTANVDSKSFEVITLSDMKCL